MVCISLHIQLIESGHNSVQSFVVFIVTSDQVIMSPLEKQLTVVVTEGKKTVECVPLRTHCVTNH